MGHHRKRVLPAQLLQCFGVIIVRLAPVFVVEVIAHHFLTMTFSRNRRVDFVTWLLVAAIFNLAMPCYLPMPGDGRFSLASQRYGRLAKILYDSMHVLHAWIEMRFCWFCVSLLLAYSGRVNYNQFHVYTESKLLQVQAHVMAIACLIVSLCFTDQRSGGNMIPMTLVTAMEHLLRKTRSVSSCASASSLTASSSDSSVNTVHSESSTASSISSGTQRILRQFKSELAHTAARNVRKRRGAASRGRGKQRQRRTVSKGRVVF
ncbi:hypothetical protein LSAT2_014895 [Lamellibrachia satsuma]|nr:hypothetical protein LSAT2_014895 [Lamellibrachia satsuma]